VIIGEFMLKFFLQKRKSVFSFDNLRVRGLKYTILRPLRFNLSASIQDVFQRLIVTGYASCQSPNMASQERDVGRPVVYQLQVFLLVQSLANRVHTL